MIKRALALTIGVAVAIAAATLYLRHKQHSSSVGVLISPGDGEAGAALPDVPAGGKLSIGTTMLCVTEMRPATITSVEPVIPVGDIAISAWGVRPNPFATPGRLGLGAEQVPLSAFPDFTHAAVSGRCDDIAHGSELAVEVTKPTAATARTNGLLVRYTIAGKQRSTVVPFTIVLCGRGDHVDHCSNGS